LGTEENKATDTSDLGFGNPFGGAKKRAVQENSA